MSKRVTFEDEKGENLVLQKRKISRLDAKSPDKNMETAMNYCKNFKSFFLSKLCVDPTKPIPKGDYPYSEKEYRQIKSENIQRIYPAYAKKHDVLMQNFNHYLLILINKCDPKIPFDTTAVFMAIPPIVTFGEQKKMASSLLKHLEGNKDFQECVTLIVTVGCNRLYCHHDEYIQLEEINQQN